MVRVGVESSIEDIWLEGFPGGIDLVRIPAEPEAEIAVDLWIASLSAAISRRQWPYLRGVRAVQSLMAGVDALLPLLPAGVTLCDARGVHDVPTAEWAVAAILAMQKNLPFFFSLQRAGDWVSRRHADAPNLKTAAPAHPEAPVLLDELAGKTVLIVGYGSIGQAIEARLLPFEVEVLRVARNAREGVEPVSRLDALLPRADIVVLSTPLTTETRGLMDAGRLDRMKNGALLVNAGRGAVVDTDALVAELRAHRLRAALDVTNPEPLPPAHPLWTAPNVLITPHVATDSSRFLRRAFAFAGSQVERFVRGDQLENQVRGEY